MFFQVARLTKTPTFFVSLPQPGHFLSISIKNRSSSGSSNNTKPSKTQSPSKSNCIVRHKHVNCNGLQTPVRFSIHKATNFTGAYRTTEVIFLHFGAMETVGCEMASGPNRTRPTLVSQVWDVESTAWVIRGTTFFFLTTDLTDTPIKTCSRRKTEMFALTGCGMTSCREICLFLLVWQTKNSWAIIRKTKCQPQLSKVAEIFRNHHTKGRYFSLTHGYEYPSMLTYHLPT